MKIMRRNYSAPWRCPTWSGAGHKGAPGWGHFAQLFDRCWKADLVIQVHGRNTYPLQRCTQCRTIVLPLWTQRLDVSWHARRALAAWRTR